MTQKITIDRSVSSIAQLESPASQPVLAKLDPILCSQAEAWKMLAIGKTLGTMLIASGQLESVRIGSRRLVKLASIRHLAELGK